REDGDWVAVGDFYTVGRGVEADDDAAADDLRAHLSHQRGGLLQGLARSRDVVNDDRRVDLARVDVLTEHALSVLALGPINLVGAQGFAHGEGDGDAAGAWGYDRDFRERARNVCLQSELARECDGEHARRIVVAEGERHLEVVRRVLPQRVDEVPLAVSARPLQNVHHLALLRYQSRHHGRQFSL